MRKGAVEMSVGFIIVVIFAVVFLSLAIVWLRGFIDNIVGVSNDLFQQAQSKLTETFRQTTSNFAVWPSDYEMEPGKKLVMAAGIKNDLGGSSQSFMINILPISVSRDVCPNGIDSCMSAGTGTVDMKTAMDNWLTVDTGPVSVDPTSVWFPKITVAPTTNAVKGQYIFNAVACMVDPANGYSVPQDCTPSHKNWGGAPQSIIITIK